MALNASIAKLALAVSVLATSYIVAAKDKIEERPAIFQKLIDCRAISDGSARLACFDTQVANLDAAEKSQDVVIVDKAQVKNAKRSLFGLTLPKLALFGGRDDESSSKTDQSDDAIETVVKMAYINAAGKWVIIIEDGAKWVQIDTRALNTPKTGHAIRIRRASLGTFFANVNKQIAIRMRREN